MNPHREPGMDMPEAKPKHLTPEMAGEMSVKARDALVGNVVDFWHSTIESKIEAATKEGEYTVCLIDFSIQKAIDLHEYGESLGWQVTRRGDAIHIRWSEPKPEEESGDEEENPWWHPSTWFR